MTEHEDNLTPAESRLHARARRTEVRPVRSATIWLVGLTLIGLGGLGLLISVTVLNDLTSHGEEGPVVALAATAVLVAAIQVASGGGILAGAGWAPNAARAVCVAGLAGGVIGLLNGGPPATMIGILLNVALLVALSGDSVRDWCGR